MSSFDNKQFEDFVRNTIKPSEHELGRDLWPQMISRFRTSAVHVPWFDWVLAAIAVIVCLLIPEALGGLLFHL